MENLKLYIEKLSSGEIKYEAKEFEAFRLIFLDSLNKGLIRSAEKQPDNSWKTNIWVKKGILQLFKYGRLTDMSVSGFPFFDKDTIPIKDLNLESAVRVVPGGSVIRTGAYVAPSVICMPPMYINIGSYVDEGTLVDSHALVGTCAQVGKNVHLSAAAQIGGVLEPAGAMPVVVEDDVMVGGNCGIYEGTIVRRRAVLGSGVILTASTKVYDLVNETILTSSAGKGLEIPEGAVLVPGSRAVKSEFGQMHGLALASPMIVKYRDEKTDARTALEASLR